MTWARNWARPRMSIELHPRDPLDVVEIYMVDEGRWRAANSRFPTDHDPKATGIHKATVAQHGNTFYLVGGYDGSYNYDSDRIYRFEVSDESWTLMPNRLKYARRDPAVMMVKRSVFPTCN